jgi:protoporphyrinogen oxidase
LTLRARGRVVIIGAGPAGLTAGYELVNNGYAVQVLEADPCYVGGIARTVRYKGFRFDIGGHRFFSKNSEIEALWTKIMGDRMRECSRMSRIYYRGRFFKYPLEPLDTLRKLGPTEAMLCVFSYLYVRCRPREHIKSFEDWIVSTFGRRLFEIFFKTYTEKVWGIPCSEISADWAAQRIRGLSLRTLLRSLLFRSNRSGVIKTLVDHFRYPACGPGEMWETVASMIGKKGGTVSTDQRVVEINRAHDRVISVTAQAPDRCQTYKGDHFISTMPLAELVSALNPPASGPVLAKARALRYRDFITVAVIVDEADVFPDHWIYIHDPSVRVGRIQNFKNWSAEMVADPRFTVLGMEYFCTENDSTWLMSDPQLIDRAKVELGALKLVDGRKVVGGAVVRQPKAYPLYDHEYRTNVAHIANFLERETPNLQIAGRNGMHK